MYNADSGYNILIIKIFTMMMVRMVHSKVQPKCMVNGMTTEFVIKIKLSKQSVSIEVIHF